MELFLSDSDGQVGSPFFHRNNTSVSFHLKFRHSCKYPWLKFVV